MITQRTSTFMTLAVCGLLAATLANAQDPAKHGRSRFPSFIPIAGGTEGVAVDKVGNVFAGVSGDTDQIWQFSPSGVQTVLADLGALGGGLAGLAVDACGDVYVAETAMPYNGVYRIGRQRRVALVPGTQNILYPDALAFDQRGTLYVTELFSIDLSSGAFGRGGIWRVPKNGTAELWIRDDLLTGLGPNLLPFPMGANGIGFYHGHLYVNNTDKAQIVRIAVRPDGSPGQPEVWKQVADVPESPLYEHPWIPVLLDGLALDVHGNVYVAVLSRAAIVRINAVDGSQETVAAYPNVPLDMPLSLTFGTGKDDRESLFVTNGGASQFYVPELPWAGPGLVKIEVGIPGLPLP